MIEPLLIPDQSRDPASVAVATGRSWRLLTVWLVCGERTNHGGQRREL
jgi:hypothetical protein